MALCCVRIGFGPTSPKIEQRTSTASIGAALGGQTRRRLASLSLTRPDTRPKAH